MYQNDLKSKGVGEQREIEEISNAMDSLQEQLAEWSHEQRHIASSRSHNVKSINGDEIDVSKMKWKDIPEEVPYKRLVREQVLVYRQTIEERLLTGQSVDDNFFSLAGRKIAQDFEDATFRGRDLLGSDPEFRKNRLRKAFEFYDRNDVEG